MNNDLYINIPASQLKATFVDILIKNGFEERYATQCAKVFADSSVDGVYTHGVNRFPRFVEYVQQRHVIPNAIPTLTQKMNAIEQWNGQRGPGITNALFATNRSMELANEFGIGCVAMAQTNHWMRGGTYGWEAAKKGFVFIGFTNTIANMPVWGGLDRRLGNNPLVIALPYQEEAIVLDMAMSQYSYGAMELAAMKNEQLSTIGGFDTKGNLSTDPSAILASGRLTPVGYWKGAGLSLLLDILAAVLSGGLSTSEISKQSAEAGLSQVFIAIDPSKLHSQNSLHSIIQTILDDYQQSIPADENARISYPGQRVLRTREQNMRNGVPVLKEVWEKIVTL